MAFAMSTSGAPVTGFSSDVMPKYFTPGAREVSGRDKIEQAQPEAGDDAANRARCRRPLPPDAHHEGREVARHGQRECPADHGQDIPGLGCRRRGRHHGDDQQQHAGDHQPAHGRGVGVDHLVVDVVRQGVGDGEQQPVRGGQRGGETAGCDQARDHVWKSRDLRSGEHDHVRVDHEVLQPNDAGMAGDRLAGRNDGVDTAGVLAAYLDQSEFTPVEQPGTNRGQIPSDDVGIDFQLRERRVGRRREVQQEDEQQRPRNGLPCLTHRGVVK